MAAGVRSTSCLRSARHTASWCAWAEAEVASNTICTPGHSGSRRAPSIPSWQVAMPALARFRQAIGVCLDTDEQAQVKVFRHRENLDHEVGSDVA